MVTFNGKVCADLQLISKGDSDIITENREERDPDGGVTLQILFDSFFFRTYENVFGDEGPGESERSV